MDHITTIEQLGGAKELALALTARGVDVEPVTVRSWKLRGRMIPAKYWMPIAKIAAERGLEVSFEALAESASAASRPERAA